MVEVARQLRRESTPSEETLWQALRKRQLSGRKFRRQQPIGPFVVDFFCAEERLVVEVDGPIHQTQVDADNARQRLLEATGLRILRVTVSEVERDLEQVLRAISATFSAPA
jgi:very-short-patch-repair endonuclease